MDFKSYCNLASIFSMFSNFWSVLLNGMSGSVSLSFRKCFSRFQNTELLQNVTAGSKINFPQSINSDIMPLIW